MSDFNFEALNQGAVAVPQAAQRSIEAWDQLNQNARVADMMVKANPDLPQRMGMAPEQFQAMSAQDRIAATTGYMKAQGAQEMQARMADWQAQAQQRNAQAQATAQDSDALSSYAQALDQKVNQPDPNDPKAVAFAATIPDGVKYQIHAAAAAGKTNPRTAAAMIKPMMDYFGPQGQGAAQSAQPKITVLPVGKPGDPGYHEIPVVQDGKGNMQVDPAYAEAQKAKLAAATQAGKAKTTFKMIPDPLNPGQMIPTVEANNLDDFKAGVAALKTMQTGVQPAGAAATVLLRDPQGNTVKAPAGRVADLLKKGYSNQ